MSSIKYFPFLFALTACAIDPVATADYAGLGNSEVGKTLRYSAFTSEVGINYAVDQLVKKLNIIESPNPRLGLETIGFFCETSPSDKCSYDGYAKTEIISADRSRKERFKVDIHIEALVAEKSIKIDSKTKREDY